MKNRFEEKVNATISQIEYAMALRLKNPTLSTKKVFSISKEMYAKADSLLEQTVEFKSKLQVDDIVKCINNSIMDEGCTACIQLEIKQQYKVLKKLPNGTIIVNHPSKGKIPDPFYPDRFELVRKCADTSTAE